MKKIIFTLTLLFSFITINAQVNLEDGLIAYYPFNGNADDESGNDYHGEVYDANLTTDKDGIENSAYWFDGEGDFIKIPDHEALRLSETSFTISLWAYIDDFTNPNSHAFLSKRNGLDQNGYMFHVIGNNHINGALQGRASLITSGGNNPNIGSQTLLTSQDWVHLVVTTCLENNISKIYINSVLDNTQSALQFNSTTTADLFIGKDELTESGVFQCCDGYFFNGGIDEVRLYNRKLTDEEVVALYEYKGITNSLSTIKEPSINIYPNPVNNTLFIKTESEQIDEMSLINISGQSVYQGKFKNEISVSGFTSGIYFLQLKNKNGGIIKTEKVVIVNENRV